MTEHESDVSAETQELNSLLDLKKAAGLFGAVHLRHLPDHVQQDIETAISNGAHFVTQIESGINRSATVTVMLKNHGSDATSLVPLLIVDEISITMQ